MREIDSTSQGTRSTRMLEFALAALVVGVGVLGYMLWKKKEDRAGCVLNLRNVQISARSHGSMTNRGVGEPIDWKALTGPGGFLESMPVCPCGGTYTLKSVQPDIGTLVMECSIKDHVPASHSDW